MKNIIKTALACAAIVVTASACSGVAPQAASGGDSEKNLEFATVAGFDDTNAVTALWSVLLEEKGYTVKANSLDLGAAFAGIAKGDIDGYLNAWLPSTHQSFVEKYSDKLDVLEESFFDGNRLVLAVPNFVEENTISELVQNADKYDNKIIGIEAGSGLMKLLPGVLEKYNAQDKFTIVEGSTPAALAALKDGIDKQKPVVNASWQPYWVFASLPIKALEDDLQAWPAPDGSHPVVSKQFSEKHPEIREWLANSKLTGEQFTELILAVNEAKDNPNDGAKKWLETPENRQTVDSWMKS